MPQTQKGSWFLHYKDKMDVELIETIKATIYEIWKTKQRVRALKEKKQEVPKYLRSYLRRLDTNLNKMRSVAVYYKEYSSIENLQLLGESYIKQMKRDLTPKTFQTSILCQRIGITKDGFYSSMREAHKYNASNFEYLDSLGYDFDPLALDSRADKDINPLAPICIGMDYNANISWIVAGQPEGRRLNVVKSFYTKFERKIPALIEDFCNYFTHHQNKTVVYYYYTTALGANYAVNDQDFHWVVCHEFERRGWLEIMRFPLERPNTYAPTCSPKFSRSYRENNAVPNLGMKTDHRLENILDSRLTSEVISLNRLHRFIIF